MNSDQITPHKSSGAAPIVPRKAIFASFISALLAACAATLIWLGALSAPQTETFTFSRGIQLSTGEEERLRAFMVPAAQDAAVAVTIVGHTAQLGDANANTSLSTSRAERVAQIAQSMGITPDQISTVGVGGAAPLQQSDGQTDRAFQASLARADVTLQVRR